MGALAIALVIGAGLVIGFGVQYLTRPRSNLEWLYVAVATTVGAFIGSELLNVGVFTNLGPEYTLDGLAIVPAVIAGLIFGLIADLTVRYVATPEAL